MLRQTIYVIKCACIKEMVLDEDGNMKIFSILITILLSVGVFFTMHILNEKTSAFVFAL